MIILDERTMTKLMSVLNDEKNLELIMGILGMAVTFLILKLVFDIIRWFVEAVWSLLTGKKKNRGNPLDSKDWLVRAQARQEVRMNNSLPPLNTQAQPQRKRLFSRKDKPGKYATGWAFNEETQLWEPPKRLRK